MAFWSNPNAQPKLSFKYFASFGIGDDIIRTYTLRSFQRPSFSIATSEYIWLNDVNFKPGVLTWNPIEIVLTDGEGRDENNAKKLYDMLNKSGYQTTNINEPRSVIEKAKSSNSLGGQMIFTQIDANSIPVEEWILVNPFMEAVNFGQNNYAAEEIVSISLTIRYDYAQYNSFSF
tara:strand:+ start:432 stop:956 length:525 start_codon:yes stop_codon:yes gene_type:complete